MGQGFDLDPASSSSSVASMNVVLVVAGAINYQNTRINVQFWDSYNSSGASVFSNPVGGVQSFTTGPITTTGATAYLFTLTFASPLSLTGLTGHGLAINWQSDPNGTGTFANDTLLTSALRGSGSANIASGVNDNPSSGYYRNASGETDFNFPSTDARSLSGVSNGGLVFDLTVVPEPSALALGSLGLVAIVLRRRK
jgi:hypothetical protein